MWDFSIQTDRVIEHRRPDIVIVDWEEKECIVIDVAIPADQNIADKEWEKISKYSELKLEIMRLWNVSGEVRGHACHAEHDKTFSKITFFSITKKWFF